MTRKLCISAIATAALLVGACSGKAASASSASADISTSNADSTIAVPKFNVDSAYAYVAFQCNAGPRVPGSDSHAKTAAWIEQSLRKFGADTVIVQRGTMPDINGKSVAIRNILAQYNPDASERLLLLAHYDTRPWADEDPNPQAHNTPIDGANDGASGVGVLLEIARQLGAQNPGYGVDILMADAEDSGLSAPEDADEATRARYDDSWCLGTQYFARNLPYNPANMPSAAILLDMVGGHNAVFPREYFSAHAAPGVVQRISEAAVKAGYAERFPSAIGGAVNDDHLPLIAAGIPAADIIEIGHPQTQSFNPTWHTLSDNLSNIDPATLNAVGSVILTLIYNK